MNLNTLKKMEDVTISKALQLVEVLKMEEKVEVKEAYAKNGNIEYCLNLKDGYFIKVKPTRKQINVGIVKNGHIAPTNFIEVYPSKDAKSCNVWTRGSYLLKLIFKDTKKDKELLSFMRGSKKYHENCDMKHSFKLSSNLVNELIKKYMKLDYNSSKTTIEGIVEEDERLDSTKFIELVDEDVEEEE